MVFRMMMKVSELRRIRRHGAIVAWLRTVPDSSLYVSMVEKVPSDRLVCLKGAAVSYHSNAVRIFQIRCGVGVDTSNSALIHVRSATVESMLRTPIGVVNLLRAAKTGVERESPCNGLKRELNRRPEQAGCACAGACLVLEKRPVA
jgi:hypothetical protein